MFAALFLGTKHQWFLSLALEPLAWLWSLGMVRRFCGSHAIMLSRKLWVRAGTLFQNKYLRYVPILEIYFQAATWLFILHSYISTSMLGFKMFSISLDSTQERFMVWNLFSSKYLLTSPFLVTVSKSNTKLTPHCRQLHHPNRCFTRSFLKEVMPLHSIHRAPN